MPGPQVEGEAVENAPMDRLAMRRAARAWLLLGLAAACSACTATSRLDEIERELRGQPERALPALAEEMRDMQGAERVAALVLRGEMQVLLPDEAGVRATAGELEALTASGVAPLATAGAGLLRARMVARQGPIGRADRALTEARAHLPANAPAALRLRFIAAQAELRYRGGRLDEAVALGQQAVALADAELPAWQRAMQRSALAWTLVAARQPERAEQVNDEATVLARESGDALTLSSCMSAAGNIYNALGRIDDELRVSREAIVLARQAGATRVEANSMANLADTHLTRGDYAAALELARQALPLARSVREPRSESLALVNAGLALISMGRADEGMASVREGLLVDERAGALTEMAQIQHELGMALQRTGRLHEAWTALLEHRRLSDELFRRDQQQAMLELQEAADAERRQRELATRQTENGLQEAQLQRRNLEQGLWAVGLAVGLLLVAVAALLLRRLLDSNARLRDTNAKLATASERDPLTGLSNRRHFLHAMQGRTGAFAGSLLLIDLDHFKHVNDRHGHAVGDALLVEVARRLRQAVRERDLAVRWGGEEFLVVADGLSPDEAQALAERLLQVIAASRLERGAERVAVTASIGYATFPQAAGPARLDWASAVDLVDGALYLAKSRGRNHACGVRALHATAAVPSGEQGAGALASAWRDGLADLVHISGPVAPQPAA